MSKDLVSIIMLAHGRTIQYLWHGMVKRIKYSEKVKYYF